MQHDTVGVADLQIDPSGAAQTTGAPRNPRDAPADRNKSQPKIRPWVFEVAAA
ncbi:hypothetical protein MOTT12_00197 [Mycobacterium intracellulare subsp. yongonense]|nr:hypothetical protein MOTT12_00197 [Mycobacterium intracellulare subsp. yongonense]